MILPFYRESSAPGPRLRVAVLLDELRVPHYAAEILEDIARSSFATIDLVIVARVAAERERGAAALVRRMYQRVDRAVAGDRDPLALVDSGPWLAGVDRLTVDAGDDGEVHLDPSALAVVEGRKLDVILRFSSAVPRGSILRAARAGVWSYHYGDGEHPRGDVPFFRESAAGATTLDVQLEVAGDDATPGLVLCRSTFAALGTVLPARQRHVPVWETTHFVAWKLHDLHERGWDHVRRQAVPGARGSLERAPERTAVDTARALLPRVVAGVKRRIRRQSTPVRHRWCAGIRRTTAPVHAASGLRDASDFRWIEAPAGHYFADPFLFEHQGRTWLFCEDFRDALGFAGISRAEVAPDGTVGLLESCLDPGFHLSFPHVFAHDGEIFMIPESNANGTVTLYRARRFPDVWAHEKVLFQGNAVDTALAIEGGRFYFFTTLFDHDDRGMKAMLFVADTLTGAWRLHPRNPVSSDVRAARGAGALFRRGGRFFRPVQDCGPNYGYGLILDEILALDEERYDARPFCRVEPSGVSSVARGVHTYNQAGDLEVIDCLVPCPVTGDTRPPETPKPPARPVTMGETPKPPARPVTMGETPKPPARPV